MFKSNLEQIVKNAQKLLDLDDTKIDKILSKGHDWARDHISSAKDDVDEVYQFFFTNKKITESRRFLFEMDYRKASNIFKEYGNIDVSNLSDAELKNIYRKLQLRYHPDKTGGSTTISQDINDAYNYLKKYKPGVQDFTKQKSEPYKEKTQQPRNEYWKDHWREHRNDYFNQKDHEETHYEQPKDEPIKHSFIDKLKNRMGFNPEYNDDMTAYTKFKRQLKKEKRMWEDAINSGVWDDKKQAKFEEWLKNAKDRHKNWLDYLNTTYGYKP